MAVRDFVPELPAFADHPALRDFLEVWNGWRGVAIAPRRADINPLDIPELMRGVTLMDAIAPENLHIRYVGSLLCEIVGQDITGQNYIEYTAPEVREIRSRRLWGVVSQPAAAVWMSPWEHDAQFVGLSVPVLPSVDGLPMKLMQVLIPLRDTHHMASERKRNPINNVTLSNQFRYVDIGAGKPDISVEA
ncbi:PAS domain-containing protein [Kordiimonas sp.]|uniref:PAS domain-containing protein n=1 Tax=Kordiimonas sp. TaxID=1970157 RepID=UPI003A954D81